MSIYGSMAAPGDAQHEDECARWEKHGDVWEISNRPCDCGQPDAPLVYQGSHILPADSDPRGGWVDIARISSFITRDARDDGPSEGCWPYLRFGVNESTVVLTRRHVQQIMESLQEWLDASRPASATATLSPPITSPKSGSCVSSEEATEESVDDL